MRAPTGQFEGRTRLYKKKRLDRLSTSLQRRLFGLGKTARVHRQLSGTGGKLLQTTSGQTLQLHWSPAAHSFASGRVKAIKMPHSAFRNATQRQAASRIWTNNLQLYTCIVNLNLESADQTGSADAMSVCVCVSVYKEYVCDVTGTCH